MNLRHHPDWAAFLLRVALGAVLLAHSLYLKLTVFTLGGTAEFFASLGLWPALAYWVFAIEVLAGTGLLLGVFSAYCSLAVLPVLLGAAWAHLGNGWLFTNPGGGWEYPLLLAVIAGVQACLGDGRFALAAVLWPDRYAVEGRA
ncbi:DoxX family protein [Marinobacterium arenosum]|uniref:DoxX family protein n=1 Tax=Marinobacterium arenosum TaxID=2862496 RepID=UPI001C986381|nr:DoxX family protein [Marinobacterium arenosum]MBY4676385.1 DoxX family protein [Marinobacterium arenosum]